MIKIQIAPESSPLIEFALFDAIDERALAANWRDIVKKGSLALASKRRAA
jgi:hypothetical protein